MNNTIEEVKAFFEQCKAFWWDIVQISNQYGWTPAKEQFALEFRGYKRGDPEPAASAVERGAC